MEKVKLQKKIGEAGVFIKNKELKLSIIYIILIFIFSSLFSFILVLGKNYNDFANGFCYSLISIFIISILDFKNRNFIFILISTLIFVLLLFVVYLLF